jgi:hypothetical protein
MVAKLQMRAGRNGGRILGPKKGHCGCTKGSPNKTTVILKDAILSAAEQVGEDGKGRDGLVGYLRRIACTEPKSFAMLLGRLLLLQDTDQDDEPAEVRYQTVEEAQQALRELGIPVERIFQ